MSFYKIAIAFSENLQYDLDAIHAVNGIVISVVPSRILEGLVVTYKIIWR